MFSFKFLQNLPRPRPYRSVVFWLFDARASRKAAIKHALNERKRIRWGDSIRQQLYVTAATIGGHGGSICVLALYSEPLEALAVIQKHQRSTELSSATAPCVSRLSTIMLPRASAFGSTRLSLPPALGAGPAWCRPGV